MADISIVRQIHDAALALGAECQSGYPFTGAPDDWFKSYATERARALTILHTMS